AVSDMIADPIALARKADFRPHPVIPAPGDLFMPERRNSRGYNLADRTVSNTLLVTTDRAAGKLSKAAANRNRVGGAEMRSLNPADNADVVGTWKAAGTEAVDEAIETAVYAQQLWDRRPAFERAEILRRAADLFESHTPELLGLCILEAGKTVPDSIAEIREAVDFLRYYAA